MSGNNFQNFASDFSQNAVGITDKWARLDMEKQQIELASVISEQEKAYQKLLTDAENNVGDYDKVMEDFVVKQKELLDAGKEQIKGGWASRHYEQIAFDTANNYKAKAYTLSQGLKTEDTKRKAFNLMDDQVANVGYDKASFDTTMGDIRTSFATSNLWTDSEKEAYIAEYERKGLHQAIKTGYQAIFSQTEGNYTDKARAAEEYVLNQNLGTISADETSGFLSAIKTLENQEYAREQRVFQEQDDKLDQEFWRYAKDGDLVGLTDAFSQKKFHDPDRNKYWWSFLQTLTDTPDKDSTSKAEREWAENKAAEIRWMRENGDITQEEARRMAETLHSTYGGNANMAPITRDLMDWSRDPKLSDNPAYSYGVHYLEDQVKNLELDEDHPALVATIQDALQKYAHEEGTDFLQTEGEFRKIVDSLLIEPVIKKMNDTIGHQRIGDQNTLNTSEELTQQFQNGNFRVLLDVDDDGNINAEKYKDWVNAWGIRGKEENIDQFINDYIEDFGRAARRDFGFNAMVHVDQQTKRPIIEDQNGDKFVLHVVDKEEKERLANQGIDGVKKNDEAWYKWNAEKGEYEYYQGVGRS